MIFALIYPVNILLLYLQFIFAVPYLIFLNLRESDFIKKYFCKPITSKLIECKIFFD